MDDAAEQAWMDGNRAAWVRLLRQALNELGYKGTGVEEAAWVLEREAAIAKLRSLCAEFGDNDWEPSLHLTDIIDKHLGRYLEGEE